MVIGNYLKRKYAGVRIYADSAEEAFHDVLELLKENGRESSPRGMKIKELLNVGITIANPRARIIACHERKFSAPYAFGELAWYMSGRNDLEMMSYYSKFMERGTDDGVTLNSAYGYRIFGKHDKIGFDQWERAVQLLKEDSDTRQAVIHLHTPNNKKTNDEVCTMCLQFLLRDGKLDMITTMRSNDIVLGFTYDVFAFTIMQELMAEEIGAEIGEYHHNVGSMHIYENKFGLLEKHSFTILPPMPPVHKDSIKKLIEREEVLRGMAHSLKGASCEKGEEEEAKWKECCSEMVGFRTATSHLQECFEEAERMMGKEVAKRTREEVGFDFEVIANGALLVKMLEVAVDNDGERMQALSFVLETLSETGNGRYADLIANKAKFSRERRKVIVEGIDKSGKSSFIEKVIGKADVNGCAYYKHYALPKENFGYYPEYEYLILTDLDVIMDRSFVSEYVYSKVLGRKKYIGDVQLRLMLVRLNSKDCESGFVFFIALNEEQMDELKLRMEGTEDEWLIDYAEKINAEYIKIIRLIKYSFKEIELTVYDVNGNKVEVH